MRELLGEVPLVLSDVPPEELIRACLHARILGRLGGESVTVDDSRAGGDPLITSINLFQRNIERFSCDVERAKENICITLIHETARFVGLDVEALRAEARVHLAATRSER